MIPFIFIFMVMFIVLLIIAMGCALFISAGYKKIVWVIPTMICVLIFGFSGTLQGEEQQINIFLYPISLICIIFLITYYLKILNIFSMRFSKSKRIQLWVIVIAALAMTSTTVTWIITSPYRDSVKYENEQNLKIYQNSTLISQKLSDYAVSKVVIEEKPDRVLEFNGFKISLPFGFDLKTIVRKNGFLMVDRKESTTTTTTTTTTTDTSIGVVNPALIIFNSKMINETLPEIKDESLDMSLKRVISLQKTYSDYSEITKALNTVPKKENDGTITSSEMNAPEVMFKKELELAYGSNLKVHRIVCTNSEINGLIYESSKMKMVEIYINNSLKYAFILTLEDQDNKYIDYILSSIEQ